MTPGWNHELAGNLDESSFCGVAGGPGGGILNPRGLKREKEVNRQGRRGQATDLKTLVAVGAENSKLGGSDEWKKGFCCFKTWDQKVGPRHGDRTEGQG